jgi:hypothetical protein
MSDDYSGSQLTGRTREDLGATQYEVQIAPGVLRWVDEGSELHQIACRNLPVYNDDADDSQARLTVLRWNEF